MVIARVYIVQIKTLP